MRISGTPCRPPFYLAAPLYWPTCHFAQSCPKQNQKGMVSLACWFQAVFGVKGIQREASPFWGNPSLWTYPSPKSEHLPKSCFKPQNGGYTKGLAGWDWRETQTKGHETRSPWSPLCRWTLYGPKVASTLSVYAQIPPELQTTIHSACIGVLFRLVSITIDGTGFDGGCSIYQGHLLFQKATYCFATCQVFCGSVEAGKALPAIQEPKDPVWHGEHWIAFWFQQHLLVAELKFPGIGFFRMKPSGVCTEPGLKERGINFGVNS